MFERKIVKSGNTSYVLALPIDWIRRNNLGTGRTVLVTENDLGNLIISPKISQRIKKTDIVTIKVDGKDEERIFLELLNAYIRNASSIVFEGKEITEKDAKIIDFVSKFIGLDVIEHSTKIIVVKNFFTLDQDMSPDKILRKIDQVNQSSIKILEKYFTEEYSKEEFFELQKLNNQTKRLFTLFRKIMISILESPTILRTLHSNTLQIAKNRIFAQSLMRTSECMLLMGKAFRFLDISKKQNERLHRYFRRMNKDYKKLLNTIYNKIYDDAFDFLIRSEESQKRLEDYLKLLTDPLEVQAIISIINIYSQLNDIAYEAIS